MAKQKPNHTCVICGKGYHSCDTCNEIKTYTPWRTICDTQNHYLIYITLRSYQENIISKEDAKKQLAHCGITKDGFGGFLPPAVSVMNEIFADGNS